MRAQSLVEVALVLPLLILAGAGVVQFSLWMHAEGIVTAAVQDGARVASSESGTLDQGSAVAQSLLRDGLGPNAALVQLAASQDASSVRFEVNGTLPALLPWGPATAVPLHASASMSKDQFVP
jgi:Flp pilus assembly protein TadG